MPNDNLEDTMHCYEPDHDKEAWMTEIICNRCQNKLGGMSCKAFPNGIPIQILRENAHYVSVPGDNGITFVEK